MLLPTGKKLLPPQIIIFNTEIVALVADTVSYYAAHGYLVKQGPLFAHSLSTYIAMDLPPRPPQSFFWQPLLSSSIVDGKVYSGVQQVKMAWLGTIIQ